ncbi:gem-associated protein 8 [Gastrophryne carolinensis]
MELLIYINHQANIYFQDTEPWYAGRVYSRYWKHYSQAMQWLYKHKRAYRMAVSSLCYPPWYLAETFQPVRYADWEGESSHSGIRTRSPKRSRRQRPCLKVSSSKDKESEMEQDPAASSDSGDEIECDMSNMEITEELRQYFEQTEKHREELKRQQKLEEELHGEYVDAGHDLYVNKKRSTQPPSERPGERRRLEMKKLYGEDAAKIQGMETAIQLNFDRHCDKKQPKYWPIIPLKL